MSTKTAWLAALLIVGAAARPAHGEGGTKVAVLGVQPVKVPTGVALRVSAALKEHVQRTAGYKLVPGKALDEIKLVFGCVSESPDCMAKVGRDLKSSKLLWGRLTRARRGFRLTLKLLDVPGARIEKTASGLIPRRAARDPSAAVARVASQVIAPAVGTITLNTAVVGAQIVLDGKVIGSSDGTPLLLRDVSSGAHVVQLRKQGYLTWVKRVELQPGTNATLSAKLEPLDTGKPEVPLEPKPSGTSSSRTGWQIAFWSGLAASVGIGVGLVINGIHVLDTQDQKTALLQGYNTRLTNGEFDTNPAQKAQVQAMVAKSGGCAQADSFSDVKQVCDDGKKGQLVQNVLWGVGAAVWAATAFFGFKAFWKRSGSAEHADKVDEDRSASRDGEPAVQWRLIPNVGPKGASLGLDLRF